MNLDKEYKQSSSQSVRTANRFSAFRLAHKWEVLITVALSMVMGTILLQAVVLLLCLHPRIDTRRREGVL